MESQFSVQQDIGGRSLRKIKISFHPDYPTDPGDLLLSIDDAAKMFTDFSEYRLGAWVPGWKPVWGAPALSFEVAESAQWRGLELRQDRKARSLLAWTGAGEHEDVELLGRFRSLGTPSTETRITYHLFRARANAVERSGLGASLSIRGSAAVLRLHEMRRGDIRRISRTELVFVTSHWHWLRFRAEGKHIYGKIWSELDPEPHDWTLQGLAPQTTGPGLVGLGMATPSHVQWSQVGLAVHGLTAPRRKVSY